jgi:hypothetical protein
MYYLYLTSYYITDFFTTVGDCIQDKMKQWRDYCEEKINLSLSNSNMITDQQDSESDDEQVVRVARYKKFDAQGNIVDFNFNKGTRVERYVADKPKRLATFNDNGNGTTSIVDFKFNKIGGVEKDYSTLRRFV